MNAIFNDTGTVTIQYNKGKVQQEKILSLASFVSVLQEESEIKTSILPAGCKAFKRKGKSVTLLIEIPPIVRHIEFHNRSEKTIFNGNIPLPWTYFILPFTEESNKYRFRPGEAYLFAGITPVVNNKTLLYRYPTPNVHAEGKICWGSTFNSSSLDNGLFNELSEVGRVIDYFYSSIFNTDLSPSISGFRRYEDFLRDSKDKLFFDNDLLQSTGNKISKYI